MLKKITEVVYSIWFTELWRFFKDLQSFIQIFTISVNSQHTFNYPNIATDNAFWFDFNGQVEILCKIFEYIWFFIYVIWM